MLSGTKFPQNVRAMRLVVEELLRGIMRNENITFMDELLLCLDKAASASKTSKLWVDCLIKPVFIMMMYVRAEREGDWPLHLVAVKQMLPYFFAAAHVNYARYGLYYLGSMESLGPEEISKFMKREHVMHTSHVFFIHVKHFFVSGLYVNLPLILSAFLKFKKLLFFFYFRYLEWHMFICDMATVPEVSLESL